MSTPIPEAMRAEVRRRAAGRCEYCGVLDPGGFFPHHVDHVIAEQHGGDTRLDNLALACPDCNWKKGPNIASLEDTGGDPIALFNPRRQEWADHFARVGPQIFGMTPTGRVTARLLDMNLPERLRERLSAEGDEEPADA